MKNDSRIDLTEGPILKTLVRLAVPVTVSMVMFTVYLMVDLYFVGRLGPDAVAAVSISGNAFFIHLGFSTILGTGGMALIAQAFGRKEYDYAATVFKQCIYLRIFSLGFVMVGTIMVFNAVFQGLGKTYPSLIGAVVDNALFAGLVFTLPVYFSWGLQSIWWIKLITAVIETAVIAVWLKGELQRTRLRISGALQTAG